MHAPAEESCLELLIRSQAADIHYCAGPIRPVRAIGSSRAGYRTRHQAAIVAPVEAQPRPALPRLVLQVRGLVEFLVVVDAEHGTASRHSANSADLWSEEARRYAG